MITSTKNIVLIGFMGSGKTTVGRALAKQLGRTFEDTDQLVCRLAGMSIPDIFRLDSECAFRQLESRALLEACALQEAVIATGGGIVKDIRNTEIMRRAGVVVYLQADIETIYARTAAGTNRPLLSEGDRRETIRRLMNERIPLYESCCHLTIDAAAPNPKDVVNELCRALESV